MPTHLVTGAGGSGVSATAAALAMGHDGPVTLAALRDDGSLARWWGRPDAPILDLGAAPVLQSAEELLGGLMEQYGGDGVVAEEWRHLPGADLVAALVELGTFTASDEVLVVDLGDVHRAADLISAVTRLPWAVRHLLGLRAVWSRTLGGAVGWRIPRALDALEAAADLFSEETTRLHVVVGGHPASEAKVRRVVPALLLCGVTPGLLVQTGTSLAATSGDWAPFTHVAVAAPAFGADDSGSVTSWAAAGPLAAAAAALPSVQSLRRARAVTRNGDELTWRLPLPWVRAADLTVEHRGDDLIITAHGRSHLVTPPAVVRRSVPTQAVVENGELIVSATLRDGAWRR